MLNRTLCFALACMAGCIPLLVNAEVPRPPMCEQLHVVVPDTLAGGMDGAQIESWLTDLGRRSDLQLHVHPQTEDSLADFTAGVHDLWLGAGVETLQKTGAQPLQPALWQEQYWLWFRSGELLDVQQLPQLSGLRGAYWLPQLEQGLLVPLLEQGVDVAGLRLLQEPNEAAQILLAGTADYFLSGPGSPAGSAEQEELERFGRPLLVKPYYLAFSRYSACREEGIVRRLATAFPATDLLGN